jgi:hypothetical protein
VVTNNPAADTSPAWWPVLPEPTATGQAQPTAEASATSRPRATPRPTVAGAQPSGGGLSSYRIHGERRENDSEGPTTSEWDLEVILSPLAYHLKSEGDAEMEVIVIEQTVWTRIGEQPWRQMDLPDDQSPDDLLGGETGVTVETDVPAEDSIAWLMGGHSLHIAQGSLTEAGSDTVNGVRCRRYTVDSQMSETVTMTVPVEATAVNTYVTQGELWVADEAGLPSFVVRARVTEAVTTEVGEASSTVTEYMEQDVTDVNGAIEIQPPM